MSSRTWKMLIIVLAVIIFVLAWFLFTTPASAPMLSQTATSSEENVVVTSPAQSASVAHTFTVAGQAPNSWFFEAVFPIRVKDKDGNVIGASQAQAQGDWTVSGPVTFTSQVTVDASYEGPAKLILSKDNPSGLPQNDGSIEVPIVIQ